MQRLTIYCEDGLNIEELSNFLKERIKVPALINVAKQCCDHGWDKYIDSGKLIPREEVTKQYCSYTEI